MPNKECDRLRSLLGPDGELTHLVLTEAFAYDGEFLYRKKKHGLCKVGTKNPVTGYMSLGFLGVNYYVHRVIWMLVTGDMYPPMLDHEDHNRSNNRFGNLKPSSNIENGRNASLSKANKSGITGVHFDVARQKWVAYIKIEGVRVHLGRFLTIEEAAAARSSANELNGFHKNHGT